MTKLDLNTGLSTLENGGFCLWIGAGIGTHLSTMGNTGQAVGWADLVSRLETEAKTVPEDVGVNIPYPERLERCERRLGFQRFQRQIRESVHNVLRDAV